GRSVTDLIGTLQDLSAIGIGFVSINDLLDLTTPSGRALVGMLAVFAEFERDLLRERVKAGIAAAKKRGKHCGGPATTRELSEKIENRKVAQFAIQIFRVRKALRVIRTPSCAPGGLNLASQLAILDWAPAMPGLFFE